ncbi:MAG: hypothetical protein AAFY08_05285 [Planctomycetota bacterium]
MIPPPDSSRPASIRRGLFSTNGPPLHRRGLSLAETIIVGLAITAVAIGLVVVGRSVQSVDAEGRTRSILARLTAATRAYADDLGAPEWSSADAALRSLRRHPPAAELVAGVAIRVEPGHGLVAIDGYGRPLRFETSAAGGPGQFVSAGRDGLFGDEPALGHDDEQRRRAQADNHYGTELAPLAPMYPDAADDPPAASIPTDPTP